MVKTKVPIYQSVYTVEEVHMVAGNTGEQTILKHFQEIYSYFFCVVNLVLLLLEMAVLNKLLLI